MAAPARGPAAGGPPHPAWLVPALAYAGLIFWLSSQSNPLPYLTARVWDKALHGVEYAALAALLALGLDHVTRLGLRRVGLRAALLASLYGASDELHQAFVPGRSCELLDWAADTTGALLGAALTVVFLRRWRARASIRA
jgi:VanZ family protein